MFVKQAFRVSPARAAQVLLAAAVLGIGSSRAATLELMGGRSKTSGWRWTDAAFVAAVGDARPFALGAHRFTWEPEAELGWMGPRPPTRQNFHENLVHPVWMMMGGARIAGFWRKAYFGFDVALTKNRSGSLSSPYEFVSTLGWQGGHYLLAVRHISNASFHEPNLGETMFLLGVRFQ